ncbi:putative chitinase 10 [Branchiostoma floridae x Branchiostoma japonicum]
MRFVVLAAVLLCALSACDVAAVDRGLQAAVRAGLLQAACPHCQLCSSRAACRRTIGKALCGPLCALCRNADCDDMPREALSGGWAPWGAWSDCSASCGVGTQRRHRTCTAPAPEDGGALCPENEEETRPCEAADICPEERAYRRVCYHTNWAQYRPDPTAFFPEDIDPGLCTHLIYSVAIFEENQLLATEDNEEPDETYPGRELYQAFNHLKNSNPELKTLLSVGGWDFGSAPFSDMVSSATNRSEFIRTSVGFLRDWGFDGLDLDWEFPTHGEGARPSDKQLFTTLIQELKEAFDAEVLEPDQERLLLTALVSAEKSIVETAYEIEKISRHLDFVNLMTYDLHGSWEAVTGLSSPLYPAEEESGEARQLNVRDAVGLWLAGGAPAEKLNLGIGLHGRSFRLAGGDTSLRAPVVRAGAAGTYTEEAGMLAYFEICSMLSSGATREFDTEQKAPYAYLGNQWVGYDDAESIGYKIAFLKQEGLGGSIVWAVDLDDFSGQFCNQGRYPLMNLIKDRLEMGGSDAEEPVDGRWSAWGHWSACSVTCGPGVRSRDRSCVGQRHGGNWCSGDAVETQQCEAAEACPAPVESPYRRVCFYSSLAQDRSQPANVDPEDLYLHAGLCSHLVYAHGNMEGNQLVLDEYDYEDFPEYERFNNIKNDHPRLKTILSVGGWTFGSKPFSDMAATQANRAEFVSSTVGFLRQWDFDGLDLDWEFPAHRKGSRRGDKAAFSSLVRELKQAFVAEGEDTGREPLLLTATVAGGKAIRKAYDIPEISKHLDFMNVMTYDFHGFWDRVTGLSSPLFAARAERGPAAKRNMAASIQQWLDGGAPAGKLTVGLGLYGRSYTLKNPGIHGLRAPSAGAGQPGQYSDDEGLLSYYEICRMLSRGATRVFDEEQKGTYAYLGNQWVGYDDEESLTHKVNWMKEKSLGGWMVWSMDEDDASGQFCGGQRFPLLNALNKALDLPTVAATAAPPDTEGGDFCAGRQNGFYADPEHCGMYYNCDRGVTYHEECWEDTLWNPELGDCDWEENVKCSDNWER